MLFDLARLQASIFGTNELNFRVRDGNGWTLTVINTNLLSCEKESKGLHTLKTEQSNCILKQAACIHKIS